MGIVANRELLDLANVTGFVIDRTVTPELVLGQGCLMADGSFAAPATAVFNYSKAPTALVVKFPHPDLTYCVRGITLHPDFNSRYARIHYLSQTGLPNDRQLVVPSDMAQLKLEPGQQQVSAEDLATVQAELTVPLEHYGDGNTGAYSGAEIPLVLQTNLARGKEGLLTLLNERNKPVAYLAIGPGPRSLIERVSYKNLARNMAFFELLYRKPGGTYLFQPATKFPGPQMQQMSSPCDSLLAEGLRRALEIPDMLSSLGGPDARYVRTEVDYVPENLPPDARALVSKLGLALDGYITLDKLCERLGTDTYLALRGVREMVKNGLLQLLTESPFHSSGTMGNPIQPVPVSILQDGDPITGFYLDPLSGEPCLARGEYKGQPDALDPNYLLHSVPFPAFIQGAPILLGNQLIGLNTGPQISSQGEFELARTYEMVSIDAYLNIGEKRDRITATREMAIPFAMLEEQRKRKAEQAKALAEAQQTEPVEQRTVEADTQKTVAADPRKTVEIATPPAVKIKRKPDPTIIEPVKKRDRTIIEPLRAPTLKESARTGEEKTAGAATDTGNGAQFDSDPGLTEDPMVLPGAALAGHTVPDKDLLDFADVVGLVVDRTVVPEQVLGLGCVTDKNRLTICASQIFQYVRSPWALAVRFPSADQTMGVKAITLHPEFNTRYAHMQYIAQSGGPTDRATIIPNDLALLVIEPELQPIDNEKLGELESSLSLPMSESGDAQCGKYAGDSLPAVLKSILSDGKPGLLTLLDKRNIPIAYISVANNGKSGFQRAFYKGMLRHLAIFELFHRKPEGTYLFQSKQEFPWPNMREIESAGEILLLEAQRRAAELPDMMAKLGGPEARYVKTAESYDTDKVHPHARWVVERVWAVLDGFITLDKLWQRTHADTYLSLRGVKELLRLNLIVETKDPPFKAGRKIGLPLLPAQVEAVNIGDPLQGFFLDPLTGRPCKVHGDFLGTADDADPNSLLHSVPFPHSMPGALVIVENQLLGLNCGPHMPAHGEPGNGSLSELICIDALRDLKSRRQKTALTREMQMPGGGEASQRMSSQHIPVYTGNGSGQHYPVIPEPLMPEPVISLADSRAEIFSRPNLLNAGAIAGIGILSLFVVYLLNGGKMPEFLTAKSGHNQPAPDSEDSAPVKVKESGQKKSRTIPQARIPYVPSYDAFGKKIPRPAATPAQLEQYAHQVEEFLTAEYHEPKFAPKTPYHFAVVLAVSELGSVHEYDLTESSGEQKLDKYIISKLLKLVYPAAPHQPSNVVSLQIDIEGKKLRVSCAK